MKKRILSALIALSMIFSVIPVMPTAFADDLEAENSAIVTGGQTYTNKVLSGDANVIDNLTGSFDNGMGSFTVTMGSRHKDGYVSILVFPTTDFGGMTIWDDGLSASDLASTMVNGPTIDPESQYIPRYFQKTENVGFGGQVTFNNIDFTKSTIKTGGTNNAGVDFDDGTDSYAFTDDKIDVCIIIRSNWSDNTLDTQFVYNFTLDLTDDDFPIPVGESSVTETKHTITAVSNLPDLSSLSIKTGDAATEKSQSDPSGVTDTFTPAYSSATTGSVGGATFKGWYNGNTSSASTVSSFVGGHTYYAVYEITPQATVEVAGVSKDTWAFDTTGTVTLPSNWDTVDKTASKLTVAYPVTASKVAIDGVTIANNAPPAIDGNAPTTTFTLDPTAALDSDNSSTTWKNASNATVTASSTEKFESGTNTAVYTITAADGYYFPSGFSKSSITAPTSQSSGSFTTLTADADSITYTSTYTLTPSYTDISNITINMTPPDVTTAAQILPVDAALATGSGVNTGVDSLDSMTASSYAAANGNAYYTKSGTNYTKAGVGRYTVTLTASPDTSHQFVAGTTTVTVQDASGNTLPAGKLVSAEVKSVDGTTRAATIELVFEKCDKIATSITPTEASSGSMESDIINDGDPYPDMKSGVGSIDVDYNDGDTVTFTGSDLTSAFTNNVFTYAADNVGSGSAVKTDITIGTGGTSLAESDYAYQDVYIKYNGVNDSNTQYNTTRANTVYSSDVDKIMFYMASPALTVDPAPAVGGDVAATVNASTGTESKYKGETNVHYTVGNTTWTVDSGTLGTTFEYGKTYTATTTLTAEDGYAFPTNVASTLTVDGATTNVTVTRTDDTSVTVVKTFAFLSLSLTGPQSYDYYDGDDSSANLTYTVENGTTDLATAGITVNGTKLNTDEYTWTKGSSGDDGTLVIKANGLKRISEISDAYKSFPTTAGTTTTWDVVVNLEGGSVTGSKVVQPYDTTPYLTVSATDGGKITVKSGTDTAVYDAKTGLTNIALDKTKTYTITATPDENYVTKTLTVGGSNFTSGNTETGANLGSKTIAATFEGPKTLTTSVTTDTNATVTVSKWDGSAWQELSTNGTANTYNIYAGDEIKIEAAPSSTDYKFKEWTTAPTDEGLHSASGTGVRTFTAGDSNVTATADFENDYKEFKVTYNADQVNAPTVTGTGTIAAPTTSVSGDITTATYNILPSNGDITVAATAKDAYKITDMTDSSKTSGTARQTDTVTVTAANVGGKTVAVTSAAKDVPVWKSGTDYTGDTVKHQINVGTDTLKYDAADTADYIFKSAVITPTPASGFAMTVGTANERTINPENLNKLSAGDYTLTYTFKDKLLDTDATDVKLTKTIKITAAPTVTSVTLPANLKHGDNFGDGNFVITIGSDTYTYNNGTWDTSPLTKYPTLTVYVTDKENNVKANNIGLASFISTYAGGTTIVRHNKLNGASTDDTLRDGDVISVGLNGTGNASGGSLGVAVKPVALTVSSSDSFTKPYDGESGVKGTLSWTADVTPITADQTALGTAFTSADNIKDSKKKLTVEGTYYDSALGTTPKSNASALGGYTVKFTDSASIPNTTDFPDLANYSFTTNTPNGTITKLTIAVPGSIFSIPQAAYNSQPSATNQTKSGVKNDDITSTQKLIDSDNTSGITITYDYKYKDNTGTDVEIKNATSDNYIINVTSDATGSRAAREVTSVVVTPLNDGSESSTYYSSDQPDAKIVINYQGGGQDTYNNIAAALAGNIESVKWGTAATTAGSADVSTSTNLHVADSGKYIVATVKTAIGSGNTVGGAQITVNKIPVNVTVSATKISKVYDGDDTFTTGDTVDPSSGFTYSVAVDTATTGESGTSKYSVSGVTASGATVKFAQADVYDRTVGGSVTQAQVASASGATISDTTEYELKNTVANITSAQITAFQITIKQIDYIKPVKVGSAGTLSGSAATKDRVTTTNGYEAAVTLNETTPDDKIVFNTTYEYANTNTATAENAATVNLKTISLAAAATGNKNGNYSFTDLTDASAIPGKGTVEDRTVKGITLLLPTKLRSAITYGTAPYDYKGGADYDGLTVTIDYGTDGITTYTWTNADKWKIEESGSTAYQTNFTSVPFTLKWSAGELTTDVYVDPKADILWTFNKNGRTMTAAMGSKSDNKSVEVKQKDITVAATYDKDNDGTADTPTKNYDGDTDIKPAGTWTFTTTGAVSGDTISTIALTAGNVTYSKAAASTDPVPLHFNGKAANASDINGQFTITVDGDSDGSRAGSYKITEVTGTTTGTINKRPITLTQIENIPFVVQYSTPDQSAEQTATNKATGTDLKATFAAAGGNDANGTGTGVVGTGEAAETISVKFKYHYLDTNTVGTLTDNTNTKLELADISTTNTNYDLTATGVTAVGSVTAATVESVGITAPTIFGKTATEVQYGDAFDFDGLSVAVNYSGSVTETYTPNGYDTTTGAITKWNKHSSRTGVADADVNAADIPFSLKWNNLSPGYKKGDKLAVHAADDGVTLKAELKADTSKTATTTEKLVVGPRQVTAAATGTVSKEYDGGTAYDTSQGAVTYTFTGATTSYTAAEDITDSKYNKLPSTLAVAGESYAYDSKDATNGTTSGAQKLNITGMTIGGLVAADAANYEFTSTSTDVAASITKKTVKVKEIHKINTFTQGETPAAATATDASSDNTKSPYFVLDDTTPAAYTDGDSSKAAEVLDITFEYTNPSTAVAGDDNITTAVTSVAPKAGTNTATNYNVTFTGTSVDDIAGTSTVTAAAVTLTVTNPTQLQGTDYTFGTPLNVDGLKVNVKYGSTGDGTDYIAKVSGDPAAVQWYKGTATAGNEVAATDLPFTYAWTDLKNGGTDTTLTNGAQLPPKYYNGANIEATLKQVDSTGSQPKAQGADVTVNKKEIRNINATLGATDTISKVYDRTRALTDTDKAKLGYVITPTEYVTGYEETFAVTATPSYDSKDVNGSIGISFTDVGYSSTTSDNYKFADSVTVNEYVGTTAQAITGAITKATINVEDVYIPNTVADSTQSGPKTEPVSNVKASTSASANTIKATGTVSADGVNEADYINFSYNIVYKEADVQDTNGRTDVFVTIDNNTQALATGADTNNVLLTNYDVVWTDVTTRSTASASVTGYNTFADLKTAQDSAEKTTYLLGSVSGDKFTELSITPPTKLKTHTHGDALDLTGLSVTFKSQNHTAGTTYSIIGAAGAQTWSTDGTTAAELPAGITVTIGNGDISLTTNADLADLQAHYKNMNGKVITANATPADETLSKSTEAMEVAKATITVTPSKTTGVDKYYDGTTAVNETITYTPAGIKTFTKPDPDHVDDVTVANNTAPVYHQADVLKVSDAVSAMAIDFDLKLTGDDAENYNVTNPTGVTGTISPRTVRITEFGENIKAADAVYKDTSDANAKGTINNIGSTTSGNSNKYTYSGDTVNEGAWPNGLNAPEINIAYDYGTLVNTLNDNAAIPNAAAGTATGSFQAAFATATNNFVLDYTAIANLPGAVKAAAINNIVIDKTKKAYTYGDVLAGDELDDIEIKLYKAGETDPFETFNYSSTSGGTTTVNPLMNSYGLELVLKNNDNDYNQLNDVLKVSAATVQVVEDKTGGKESNIVDLTVAKRKLLFVQQGSADKTYNGNATVDPDTVTLKLGDNTAQTNAQTADTGSTYGLLAADATTLGANEFTITKPTTMKYKDGSNDAKNASTTAYTIQASNDTAITYAGIDTTQYEVVLGDLSGKINKKTVELTPNILEKVYTDNSAISLDGGLNKTGVANTMTVDATNGFVDGEGDKYIVEYSVKLSAAKHNAAGTYPISKAAADVTGIQSGTVADEADEYSWKISSTNGDNYPVSNYNFVLNDASVTVDDKQVESAVIVEDSKKIRTSYNSGEGIDFTDLVVQVHYNSGVDQTFEYGVNWPSNFVIFKADKSAATPSPSNEQIVQGAKLNTLNSGDAYYVRVKDVDGTNPAIFTRNSTSPITVNAKEIKVTAVQLTTPTSRDYDGTADADMFVKYDFLNDEDKALGLTIVKSTANAPKADFIEKPASGSDAAIPPSYAGEDKPIKITATDSSFTFTGTNADEYTVKWVDDPNLKGTVDKLALNIESWPVLTAGRNTVATDPATINYAGNVSIGTDATHNAVLDAASRAKITTDELQADLGKFSATFSADFTAEQLHTATPTGENISLTFTTGTPVITATGDDADLFKKNYTLTYAQPKGIVVPSAITITDVATPGDSTHGDAEVNLDGIKFTVNYTGEGVGNATSYTFKNVGGQWYADKGQNLATDAITTPITKDALLQTYGVQLRWNTKNAAGNEPDKVLGKANHEDDQKQIVIMVPDGNSGYAMNRTGNVTVNKRPIYAYVKKTEADGTTKVQLNKPYDGNALADPSGVTFDFYVPNTATPPVYDKYTNWFAGEDIKIDTPAAGTQATGTQLKAVYVGGTAAAHDGSYKKSGASWVECDIAGKDVRRDNTGAVIAKPVQLSNLHLTGAGSDNYTLVNADTWTLSAVETGYEQYEPTASEAAGAVKLSNRLEGVISPIDMKVEVTSVPAISQHASLSELKREVPAGGYNTNGAIAGDTFDELKVYVTYGDVLPNVQTIPVSIENDKDAYDELNYNITAYPTTVTGRVTDVGIKKIEILEQPQLTYEHGDKLELKDSVKPTGMKIRVTYSDDSFMEYTYGADGTTSVSPWKVDIFNTGATPGVSLADSTDTVSTPQDITLTWNGTANAVSPTDIMSCNDTNKGYVAGSDPKTTRITVTSTLPQDPEHPENGSIEPVNTSNITVDKKQLGIRITGYAEKVYDSNNSLKGANLTVDGKTPFTVTMTDKDGGAITGVAFDTAAAIAADKLTFVSTDAKPNSYVGDKKIAIANLADYLTGDYSEDAYILPTSTVVAANNDATGAITPRPITITATTLPTLDLNTATPDTEGGTLYTLDLAKTTNFTVVGPSDGTGIFQNYDGTLTADEALVVWKVTYNTATIDADEATTVPVASFSTGSLVAGETAADAANVVANYAPTFVHTQTEGPATPLVQANGIAVKTAPTKTSYDHGVALDLSGMVVTVTKPGTTPGTTVDTDYFYDKTTGGWKLEDATPVATADVPFDLYWAAENDADDSDFNNTNLVPLTADSYNFDITDLPNGFTGTNGYVTAALKADKTKNDATPISVNKLQLYMHLSGSAEKVYDKDAKLSKAGANHYDLTVVFTTSADAPAAGDPTVGTLADGQIDTWVTNGVITYKDLRTGTPDSYVGTSADDEKTLAVTVGSLGTNYLTGFDADVYTLPTEASQVKVADDVSAIITARPITLVVDEFAPLTLTEEILAENTYNKDLAVADYDVYDGDVDKDDITDETPEWILDSAVKWTITYDIAGLNLDNSRTADVTWGKDNATANAVPHQLTEAAAANYTVKWIAPDTGDVVLDTDPHIEIIKQPTAEQNEDGTYTYGAPTDWDGFEYKVVTPEGTTNHRWDKDNNDWFVGTDLTTGKEYTAPEPGTTFKWNNETPDGQLPVTNTLDVGKNEVEISVPTATDPLTAKTDAWTAGKKELTIKVSGQHSKPYDGKTTLEDLDNEVTLTLEGAMPGDVVEFATDPTVAFADKNVSYFKDPTHKPLTITGGTLSDETAVKYTIKADYTLADDADIKITPQDITILITAPAIKTSIGEASKAITKTGVALNAVAGAIDDATKRTADKFIITNDGKIADGDAVTIAYSGSYVDVTQGEKTTADKTTDDEKNAVFTFAANGTPKIEDAELAENYNITDFAIEYTVNKASTGGGGGGGGSSNSLNIHYENEDGTAGDEVSKISVPLGTEPTDLIGVIKTKINDMTVLWTSDNEDVATVDENGIVTYVGEGKATITAQSKQTKSLKDTVVITVTAAEATPAPTDKPEPTTAPRTHERVNDSLITKTMLNPYIVGYDDYVFGPELPISREELAAIFARLIANNLYMDQNYDTSFPDVPEKWSKSYIGYLEGFDVVTGYEDGMFRPENNITRAEMAVMMAKAEGYDITPDISAEEAGFPDVDAGYATWSAAKAIQILSDLGIMSGYEDGTFRPGQPITRAETVATVNRVLAAQEVAEREVLPSDVTDAHWAYEDIVFAMNHRVLKDAAADPHSFIWSEEFDKNMVTNTEKVAGEKEVIEGEEPLEDNTSDASATDETAAGTETETKEDADTPKSTDKPTI